MTTCAPFIEVEKEQRGIAIVRLAGLKLSGLAADKVAMRSPLGARAVHTRGPALRGVVPTLDLTGTFACSARTGRSLDWQFARCHVGFCAMSITIILKNKSLPWKESQEGWLAPALVPSGGSPLPDVFFHYLLPC